MRDKVDYFPWITYDTKKLIRTRDGLFNKNEEIGRRRTKTQGQNSESRHTVEIEEGPLGLC